MLHARAHAPIGRDQRVYQAPGRVNLIGEHTDYHGGFVLPAAIGLSCRITAVPLDGPRIVVSSETLNQSAEWTFDRDPPPRGPVWSNYVFGVAAAMREQGHDVAGASLFVTSTVPMGAGLSSSAALEVATATALADLSGVHIDAMDLARLCQRAEVEFVGTACGIMDQFVACHARADHALLLDCRSLAFQHVPLSAEVSLVACNTMVHHRHAEGAYNHRRAECERGVAVITAGAPDMTLRDVDQSCLDTHRGQLTDVVFRRCRHVITENERVLAAARALEARDFETVGALMDDSHRSLRDDYEVSCPELDLMVDLARELPGVVGARMTGGGFGGSTVNLVQAVAVDEFRGQMASQYEAKTGQRPDVYVMTTGGSARRVR